jgi:hypothetical protein
MDHRNLNFIYLLQTITFLVSEYFYTFEKLLSNTIGLFFNVIDTQVSMYFKIFNNLFIASLDTVRYLVNKHFKLINSIMVKNKTEHLLILSFTVIILNWNYYPSVSYHFHFYLNQTDPISCSQNSQNSLYSYLDHYPLPH